MKDVAPSPIRVVVFKRGERWIAQCLEVDLATSADSLEELREHVKEQIQCQMTLDRRRNRELFSTLKRAPDRFWRLLDQTEPVGTLEIREPVSARVFKLLHRSREVCLELRRAEPVASLV